MQFQNNVDKTYSKNSDHTCTFRLFSEPCQTCDCLSRFTQISGVYDIVIGGDLKSVYCSFESSHTWTVRWMLYLYLISTFSCVVVDDNTTNQFVPYSSVHFINDAIHVQFRHKQDLHNYGVLHLMPIVRLLVYSAKNVQIPFLFYIQSPLTSTHLLSLLIQLLKCASILQKWH